MTLASLSLAALATVGWLAGCEGKIGSTPDDDDDDSVGDDDDDDDDDDTVSIDAAAGVDGATGQVDGAVTAAGCAGSSALFCEDFEEVDLGAAASDRWGTDGDLTIDAEQARGTRALHIQTSNGGRGRMILPFTDDDNSFFGRVYVYVEAFPSAPDWSHFTMVEASGSGNGNLVRAIGGQYVPGEQAYFGVGSDGDSGDWTDWQTSAPADGGQWLCLEWQLVDAPTQINVWINGVANPDLTVEEGDHNGFSFPDFNEIWFGWWNYQGGTTPSNFNIWVDDITLDDEQIGC